MADPGTLAAGLAVHPLAGHDAPGQPPLTVPDTGVVQLTFESDWHLGTGAGIPGLLDKLISRDADDLPQVPAKSLFGIWRDAAERLAWGLDDGRVGRWHGWVAALFGEDPTQGGGGMLRPAALSLTAARLDLPALRQGGTDAAFRHALTFVKPGVRISADTGRAEPGHLRFIEMATGGLTLHAACKLETPGWSQAQRRLAWAFLAGALRLVEAAGAGRRRGQGRCTATLAGRDIAADVQLLEQADLDPPPHAEAAIAAPHSAPLAQGHRRQRLTLILRSPLVVAEGVRGNVVLTRHHVPGAMLLATLFPRLAAAMGETKARQAVASARLRVLDARPSVPEGEEPRRGEPAPFCLHAWKEGGGLDEAGTVVNLACQPEPKDVDGQPRQTKPIRGTWLAPSAALPHGALPDFLPGKEIRTALLTHNTIDDARQRPIGISEGGPGPGVYSYEAIVSKGPFIGDLQLGHGVPGLPPGQIEVRLGRSRKDDYGLASLEIGPEEEPPALAPTPPAVGESLWLRLLSDLLPVGEALGPDATVEAVRTELERRLGIGLRLPEIQDDSVAQAVRLTRIETWHTRWNLSRPTLTALAAGSVIGFEVLAIPPGLDLRARLAEVEMSGLGDRRAEGFGEVRLQDPLVLRPVGATAKALRRKMAQQDAAAVLADARTDATLRNELAGRVQRAAWQDEIAMQALVRASDPDVRRAAFGLRLNGGPSLSQLGRLREQVGTVRGREGADQLCDWLKKEATRRSKGGAPPNAQPDAQAEAGRDRHVAAWGPIATAIRELLHGAEAPALWHHLFGAPDRPPLLPGHEGDRAALQGLLWPLAFRHFLFASLRAHAVVTRAAARADKAEG